MQCFDTFFLRFLNDFYGKTSAFRHNTESGTSAGSSFSIVYYTLYVNSLW
jgi:hypothetical protein